MIRTLVCNNIVLCFKLYKNNYKLHMLWLWLRACHVYKARHHFLQSEVIVRVCGIVLHTAYHTEDSSISTLCIHAIRMNSMFHSMAFTFSSLYVERHSAIYQAVASAHMCMSVSRGYPWFSHGRRCVTCVH